VDVCESSNGGAIEQLTICEEVFIHGLGWKVKVLLDAGKVAKPDIDKFDILFLDVFHYF
jgi:hypothetical protein